MSNITHYLFPLHFELLLRMNSQKWVWWSKGYKGLFQCLRHIPKMLSKSAVPASSLLAIHECGKKVEVLVAQQCLTLWDTTDCSPPGSSVHRILQARILEWVAISFSRGSSQTRDGTQDSCIASRFFAIWVTREALAISLLLYSLFYSSIKGLNN